MNYKEIVEKLKELGVTYMDFTGSRGDNYIYDKKELSEIQEKFYCGESTINIEGLGEITIVDRKGGYWELQEGALFMEYYIIRHFVEHDVYIKLSGEYSSQEGIDCLEEYSEVKPEEQKIIVYKYI